VPPVNINSKNNTTSSATSACMESDCCSLCFRHYLVFHMCPQKATIINLFCSQCSSSRVLFDCYFVRTDRLFMASGSMPVYHNGSANAVSVCSVYSLDYRRRRNLGDHFSRTSQSATQTSHCTRPSILEICRAAKPRILLRNTAQTNHPST